MTKRKNIVLIITDQQCFDSLGCCGVAEARTPNIDALAARGCLFKNHIVTNPVCSPSRGSIMTGKYVSEHGLWANGCDLPEENSTVADAFAAAGYATAHFGKLHLVGLVGRSGEHPPYGFSTCEVAEGDQHLLSDRHWQWLREHDPEAHDKYLAERRQDRHAEGYQSVLPEELHHSTWTTDRAVSWIGTRNEEPFFLSIGFFDPHHAFDPVQPYDDLFSEAAMTEPRWDPQDLEMKPPHYAKFFAGCEAATRSPQKILRIRRAFHAMMAHVDACVGRIVQALTDSGLAEDTVLVFTSDHGEFLGNHGLLWKGPYLLDDLMRVPLIIADLGQANDQSIVEGLTSAVDLMPTMLRIAGVPIPPLVSGKAFMDESMRLFPEGQREWALAEWEHEQRSETSSIRMIRTRTHKLVVYNNAPSDDTRWGELYDLENDPYEFQNRYADPAYAPIRKDLKDRLIERYLAKRPNVKKTCAW